MTNTAALNLPPALVNINVLVEDPDGDLFFDVLGVVTAAGGVLVWDGDAFLARGPVDADGPIRASLAPFADVLSLSDPV